MSHEKAGRTLECLSENSYSIKTVRYPNFTQGVVGGCREDLVEMCQVPGMSRFDRRPLLLLKSNTSIPPPDPYLSKGGGVAGEQRDE